MTGERIALLGSESAKAAAEAWVPGYLAEVNLYRALLQHPTLAKPIADLVVFLWRGAILDDRLRELVIMRVAWRTKCMYEWAHHWPMALRAGLRPAEAAAVRDWPAAACFGPADSAVLAATDETISHGAVTDRTWAQLTEHVGDKRVLLEVLATISTWRMVSELLRSLDIPLEEGFAAWPPEGRGPEVI